jgi:hypothetical protein
VTTNEWTKGWRTNEHQAKATLAQEVAYFLQKNPAT